MTIKTRHKLLQLGFSRVDTTVKTAIKVTLCNFKQDRSIYFQRKCQCLRKYLIRSRKQRTFKRKYK